MEYMVVAMINASLLNVFHILRCLHHYNGFVPSVILADIAKITPHSQVMTSFAQGYLAPEVFQRTKKTFCLVILQRQPVVSHFFSRSRPDTGKAPKLLTQFL
jgi:hypothetical protein